MHVDFMQDVLLFHHHAAQYAACLCVCFSQPTCIAQCQVPRFALVPFSVKLEVPNFMQRAVSVGAAQLQTQQ